MSRTARTLRASVAALAVTLGLATAPLVAHDDADDTGHDGSMGQMAPAESAISVRHAWARASVMVDLAGAAYLTIHNGGDEADTLVGASSPAAGIVEMHETSMDEDGAMAMMPVAGIPLPPHADTSLQPGGYHLMLVDLVGPLVEGTEIELDLEFATARPQTVMVTVTDAMGLEMDHDGAPMDGGMSHDETDMDEDDA